MNNNQQKIQDAVIKALDEVELEGVEGGLSKDAKWGIGLAAAVVVTYLSTTYVDHLGHYAKINSPLDKYHDMTEKVSDKVDEGINTTVDKTKEFVNGVSKKTSEIKDKLN